MTAERIRNAVEAATSHYAANPADARATDSAAVRIVSAPDLDPREAGAELVRRYLHVYGPGTPTAFADWAGVAARNAGATFEAIGDELIPVRTSIGDGWILGSDERSFRLEPDPPAPARLLPSGDAYWLLQGSDRELLVPDGAHRGQLWTPRVWPGALLVDGEIAGTWRRSGADVRIAPWRALTRPERRGVEAEAGTLPLPGTHTSRTVQWST